MTYFPKTQKLFENTLLWADLRKEQGINIKKQISKLEKNILQFQNSLVSIKEPHFTKLSEPNDLQRIQELRPSGPRKLNFGLKPQLFRSKLLGAFYGRAAGCTLGHPVENWPVEEMENWANFLGIEFPFQYYLPDHPKRKQMENYLLKKIRAIPEDDDLAYTILGLIILETYGQDFTTQHVAETWQKYLPFAFTAEEVTLKNLKNGISPFNAGAINNPYQEWIGADIRSDPYGYVAAGYPELAASLAYRDAFLSHRGNGIYGAMFFAATIAAAFVVSDPMEAIEIGLSEIPSTCRLAKHIRWALKTTSKLKNWRHARQEVDKRFRGMSSVHTINNACLTVFGLYLGNKDFSKTISETVAMGLDNDCTAATAGSILGAIIGIENIPTYWWKPFRKKMVTYLRGYENLSVNNIIQRFEKVRQSLLKTLH